MIQMINLTPLLPAHTPVVSFKIKYKICIISTIPVSHKLIYLQINNPPAQNTLCFPHILQFSVKTKKPPFKTLWSNSSFSRKFLLLSVETNLIYCTTPCTQNYYLSPKCSARWCLYCKVHAVAFLLCCDLSKVSVIFSNFGKG